MRHWSTERRITNEADVIAENYRLAFRTIFDRLVDQNKKTKKRGE